LWNSRFLIAFSKTCCNWAFNGSRRPGRCGGTQNDSHSTVDANSQSITQEIIRSGHTNKFDWLRSGCSRIKVVRLESTNCGGLFLTRRTTFCNDECWYGSLNSCWANSEDHFTSIRQREIPPPLNNVGAKAWEIEKEIARWILDWIQFLGRLTEAPNSTLPRKGMGQYRVPGPKSLSPC